MRYTPDEQLRPIFGLGPRTRLALVLGGLVAFDLLALTLPKPDYQTTFQRCRARVNRIVVGERPKSRSEMCRSFARHAQTTMVECMEATENTPQVCFMTHNHFGELIDPEDIDRVCTEEVNPNDIGLFCLEIEETEETAETSVAE